MNNFIKNYPQISGLSKNKIIGVLLIVFALIFIAVLWGVSNSSSEDKPKNDEMVDTKFNNKDSDATLNQIINSAETAKLAASESIANKKSSSQTLSITVPPITKNIVPLKTDNTDIDVIKDKYDKKLQDNKYGSYSAKSLLYDKPLLPNQDNSSAITKNNSSAGVLNSVNSTTNKPSYPTSSADLVNSNLGAVVSTASTSGSGNIPDDQNMQKEKQGFIKGEDTAAKDYLSSKLMTAKSPYEIKAGSVIPATMLSGLNSDLPGQIIAQVRQNVYDSSTRRYLLIPQGAKLIGLYDSNIAYGQKRVLVIWNRLIYPNGDSINLKGMPGTDLEGYAGFHDLVDKKYWEIFGTSFVMGVITAAMQYSQNNTNPNVQTGGLGFSNNPTVGQTLSGSLGQQLGQTGLSIAQKNLNVQPTLKIRPNYPFNIMITADLILKPYL